MKVLADFSGTENVFAGKSYNLYVPTMEFETRQETKLEESNIARVSLIQLLLPLDRREQWNHIYSLLFPRVCESWAGEMVTTAPSLQTCAPLKFSVCTELGSPFLSGTLEKTNPPTFAKVLR